MRRVIVTLALALSVSGYEYKAKTFTVPLDHFSYQRNKTFNIRYFENDDHWDQAQGPIFIYVGNEASLEVFANHTGFIWEIAPEFRAKVVFVEHRYYGQSMPFGDKSLDREHIGYLTSSQALADYVELINFLQGNALTPNHPVIAFGGSYGAMLAVYIRMKYPHAVAGAIASSAPLHMFPGMIPCDTFNRIVTSSYSLASTSCTDNVRRSWKVLRKFLTRADSSDWLRTNWNLCGGVRNSSDVSALMEYLYNMYSTMAVINYPFESDFMIAHPAYPVTAICQTLNQTLDGMELLKTIGIIVNDYKMNHTSPCTDYRKGFTINEGWDYQACTEMVMPMCATGRGDMFEPSPWNFTKYARKCHDKYGVFPREHEARLRYGGALLQAASNIVLSNGLMDPWAAGGILNNVSESVTAVVFGPAAHHFDLMAEHPGDPESVRRARDFHRQHISAWIDQFIYSQRPELKQILFTSTREPNVITSTPAPHGGSASSYSSEIYYLVTIFSVVLMLSR